jgi:hypothetical protein
MRPLPLATTLLAAFAAGLLQGALLPDLPRPFAAIDLPLLLAAWLAIRFRFPESLLAAAVAGLTRGALSAMPALVWALAYAACAAAVIFLFTRVFTNRSWTGLLGLTATAYASLHLLTALARLVFAFAVGASTDDAFAGLSVGGALLALLTQLAAATAAYALAARARTALGLRPEPR